MLRKAYLPAVTSKVPDYNGNGELAMTDAAIGMAVFLEDRTAFEGAVRRYRARVPAYFSLSSDGALPKAPPGGTSTARRPNGWAPPWGSTCATGSAATAPKWLCGGKVERTMGPDVEVALNHLEGRMGMKLPQTAKLAMSRRPSGTDDLFVAWETLTHASNPTPA